MNTTAYAAPHATRWATASQSDAGRGQPMEVDSLGSHLGVCLNSRGRWFPLECMVETVHGFVAPRLVTTLALAVLVLAASTLVA